jgi:hypothetical protein
MQQQQLAYAGLSSLENEAITCCSHHVQLAAAAHEQQQLNNVAVHQHPYSTSVGFPRNPN